MIGYFHHSNSLAASISTKITNKEVYMNKLELVSKLLENWDDDAVVALRILVDTMLEAQDTSITVDDGDKTIIDVQQNKVYVIHNDEIILTLEVK